MGKTMMITTSDGKEYPCRVTLGAMRRFKTETGKEADKIEGVADMAVFMWCCCISACRADGIEFNYGIDDFCDRLDIGAAETFGKAITSSEKKTKK